MITNLILVLLLTACSQEVDLYFFLEEAWKVETTIEVTTGSLSSLTDWISEVANDQLSDLPVPDELGSAVNDIVSSGSEAGMDQIVAYYGARGIAVDWKKRDIRNGAEYELTFEGRGEASFESLLPEGMLTLGGLVEVKHLAPTPLGFEIRASACLLEVKGPKLVFEVGIIDEVGRIGEGRHVRFVASQGDFSKAVRERSGLRRRGP